MYGIILSNFLLTGGDGYSMIRDHSKQSHIVGNLDTDTFADYVTDFSPLYTALENRIEFVDDSYTCNTNSGVMLKINFYQPLLYVIVFITHKLYSDV